MYLVRQQEHRDEARSTVTPVDQAVLVIPWAVLGYNLILDIGKGWTVLISRL